MLLRALLLVAAASPAAGGQVTNATLLTRVPMIMTHDAGSGYLGKGLVNGWTRTQSVGLAGQLACGARAFDARPLYANNKLVWHHGDIHIDYAFAQSLTDIIDWLAVNPTELAVLLLWDCAGAGCNAALTAALDAANVTTITDCSMLPKLTYGAAKALGAMPKGGSLLAITGGAGPNGAACSAGNYDPANVCSAFELDPAFKGGDVSAGTSNTDGVPKPYYGCWTTDSGRAKPINYMLGYLDKTNKAGAFDDHFSQMQAIWQEGTDSVVIGTLRHSSLLIDETKSGLNTMNAGYIAAGRWSNISLFEVNNVCDGGPALLAALQKSHFFD